MKTTGYVDDELTLVRSISQTTKGSTDVPIVTYKDAIAIVDVTPVIQCLGVDWCGHPSLWIVKDICGIICALVTWLLLVFAEYVLWSCVLLTSRDYIHSFSNGVVFQLFTCLAAFSHLRAMFTDPGAVPRGNATKENIAQLGLGEGQVVYRCSKCVCIKPIRAHHCSVCRRCIRKMDHHCPWINNCVGESNQKFFILFTMYVCIISIHAFYLTVRHFVICSRSDWKDCPSESPVLSMVLTVLLLFESVLFSIFTGIMFGSQVWAIWTDTTGIENVKRESRSWHKKTGWRSIRFVFGYQFSCRWFSPFHSSHSVFTPVDCYRYDYNV